MEEEDLRHIVENQIMPQLVAARLRDEGADVDLAHVNVDSDATGGYEITCVGCGRIGRVPFQLPAGKAALCPQCMRNPPQPTETEEE